MRLKLSLLLPLFIVGLLVPAGQAHADQNYDGCDYAPADIANGGPWSGQAIGCPSNHAGIPSSMTLYSVEVYVTKNTGDVIMRAFDHVTGNQIGQDVSISADSNAPGYKTYHFPNGINYGAGARPYIQFFSPNNNDNIRVAGYPYTNNSFIYRVFNWSPPIVPPSTENNEVIQYYPSAGTNTPLNTTLTIGAQFSIGSPSVLEGIGYRLVDPYGNEVFNDTADVTTAQTQSITTEYTFDKEGIYQGHAYFIQKIENYDPYGVPLGTYTTWKVDNQKTQQIQVGEQKWVVNPDGSIRGLTATTTVSSTSPLYLLNIQCAPPDGIFDLFAHGCRLFNFVFNPDLQYLTAVKQEFAVLLTKFPFSLFTGVQKVFSDGATAGQGGGGGSLSLTLYGSNVPILAPAALTTVGVSPGSLSTLRTVMTAGLWMLFLWYLFWRFANVITRFRRML